MKQHFARFFVSQSVFCFVLLMLVSFPLASAKAETLEGYYFVEVPKVTNEIIDRVIQNSDEVFNFVRYFQNSNSNPQNYEGAYLVKGSLNNLQRISGAHVNNYYAKEDFKKIDSQIISEISKVHDVAVLLFENADYKKIIAEAKKLGLQVKEYNGIDGFDAVGLGDKLELLSRVNGVQFVGINEQFVPTNQYTSVTQGGHYTQNNWALYGANQIVAVTDSGLDNAVACTSLSNCNSLNPTLHPDLAGRIVGIYDISACNPGCSTTVADMYGHGTSTAGRVAGNGFANGTTNPMTHSYQNGPAAMAPEAKMYIQDVATDGNNPSYVPPTSTTAINAIYAPARNAGTHTHTLGYGTNTNGAGLYGASTQKIDQFTFTNKDYLFTLGAGNGGTLGMLSTVGSPGTSKNGISVGAWNIPNPFMGASYGSSVVTDYSGIGPTADGRIKPDVIAVEHAVTTRSSLSPYAGLPGLNGNYYTPFHGTSSSTPSVAGTAALVREYLQRYENMTNPNASASMIKAVILNGAQDIGYGIPSNEAGWGAVSLADSLPNGPKHLYVWDHQSSIITGQIKTDTVSVNAGQPLRVTLVWTDKEPASFSNPIPTLVNNLNLEVIDPTGTVYNGNDFSAPYNNQVDVVNNVERVEIPSPMTGNYQIRVIGASVPMPTQTFSVATTANLNDLPISFTAQPQNVYRNNLNLFSTNVPYTVTDPNTGDGPITMSWVNKPSWISGTPTATGVFISASSYPAWGDYPVMIQGCNRRGQCAQATFHIIVNGDLYLTNTPPVVGTTMTFTLSSPANSNQLYAFVFAFGNTSGIVLPDGRQLGVDLDDLAQLILNDPASLGMSPTVGPLNTAGQATITLPIPNIPILGLTLHAGWIVINPTLGTIPAATLTSLPFTFQ